MARSAGGADSAMPTRDAKTDLLPSSVTIAVLLGIAGHSSITITQRYVHPQADAIEQAFANFGAETSTNINSEGTAENSQVGTNLGTTEVSPKREPLQLVGAKGGTRTPTVLPARS